MFLPISPPYHKLQAPPSYLRETFLEKLIKKASNR